MIWQKQKKLYSVLLVCNVILIIAIIGIMLLFFFQLSSWSSILFSVLETMESVLELDVFINRIPFSYQPDELSLLYPKVLENASNHLEQLFNNEDIIRLFADKVRTTESLMNIRSLWGDIIESHYSEIGQYLDILAREDYEGSSLISFYHSFIINNEWNDQSFAILNLFQQIEELTLSGQNFLDNFTSLKADTWAEIQRNLRSIFILTIIIVSLGLVALIVLSNFMIAIQRKEKLEHLLRAKNAEEQNRQLEIIIDERTKELRESLKELKDTQGRLIESEKMAALGNLVVGISHEMNTPLGICVTASSYLQTLTRDIHEIIQSGNGLEPGSLEKYIASVNEAGILLESNLKRSSDLIQNFKQISVDQNSDQLELIYFPEFLENLISMLRLILKPLKIDVIVESGELFQFKSYPGTIVHVLSTLVQNSRDHGFGPDDEGSIRISYKFVDGSLLLYYRDDGRGADEKTLNHIYEPFFTTARGRGGTGLGMHVVYNLITQRLKGSIDCSSEPGKGIEFRIEIPNMNGNPG